MENQLTFQVVHSRRLRVARFYFQAPTMLAAIRYVEQTLGKSLPATMAVYPVF